MTDTPDLWLLPDAIFDGQTLRQGAALAIAGTRSLRIDTPPPGAAIQHVKGTLTPGFLDL